MYDIVYILGRCAVEEYIWAVKKMCCEVLEVMADGLGIRPRNVLSRMIRDERSDSCLRVNRYPACGEVLSGGNKIGFGEHTDPQIISALRSNNTAGLQICLKDGTWASILPDDTSFFFNIGDLLQVHFLTLSYIHLSFFTQDKYGLTKKENVRGRIKWQSNNFLKLKKIIKRVRRMKIK